MNSKMEKIIYSMKLARQEIAAGRQQDTSKLASIENKADTIIQMQRSASDRDTQRDSKPRHYDDSVQEEGSFINTTRPTLDHTSALLSQNNSVMHEPDTPFSSSNQRHSKKNYRNWRNVILRLAPKTQVTYKRFILDFINKVSHLKEEDADHDYTDLE